MSVSSLEDFPLPSWCGPSHDCHDKIARLLADVLERMGHTDKRLEKIMAALDDLKAADQALQTEVATFLADVVSALNAQDPDLEAITSDINAQIAALQAGDPANAAPPAP